MNLDEAIEIALSGNAFLFAGAGCSLDATNILGAPLKSAGEFSDALAKEINLPEKTPLEDVSEEYIGKFSAAHLVKKLKGEFTVRSVVSHQLTLAKVPWRRIYTTNYDNVIETASGLVGRKIQSVTMSSPPFSLESDRTACVHLNGYIDSLTEDKLGNEFKLTETSYVASSLAGSQWAIRLQEDANLAKAIFFIGYSLYDLDVKRIINTSPFLKEKSFFIIKPDANLERKLQRYGTVITSGVASFADLLLEKINNFSPPAKANDQFNSIEEVVYPHSKHQIRDKDVIDLFELGVVDDGALVAGLTNNSYALERHKVKDVLDDVDGTASVIAVTSGLANGKSLFLRQLSFRAIERGYRVFRAKVKTPDSIWEFEQLARVGGKKILIIENYQAWFSEIKSFREVKSDLNKLIVTARESTHDVQFSKLEEISGLTSVREVSLNKLNDSEIEWFVNTLDLYGLWKSQAGHSLTKKKNIIIHSYKGEIHGLLLGLLKSQDIGQRVAGLMSGVKSNKDFLPIVTSIFVLATLELSHLSSIDTLSSLWGVEVISSSSFRNHESVKELLDFKTWNIRVKSSIVSEYVLQSVLGTELIPILTLMIKGAAKAAGGSSSYNILYTELMKYSTLQRLLPEAGRREACIIYYEGIKDIPQGRRRPLFWLQFAIACFVEGDLKRARNYFETSYSLAKKIDGFNTFQIDNHYARFLLIEAVNLEMPVSKAMAHFRQARAIINRQMPLEKLNYVYKVAKEYQAFLDRFSGESTPEMLKEVRIAAEQVLERIQQVDDSEQEAFEIKRCKDAMIYVVDRCSELVNSALKGEK